MTCSALAIVVARPFINYSGRSFGAWTVLDFYGKTKGGKPLWNCLCECGTKKPVIIGTMQQGRSKSCGCKTDDKAANFAKTIASRVSCVATFKCEFCMVEPTRYKKEIKSSLGRHGRIACKSCAVAERNKSNSRPIGSTRLHKKSGYIDVKIENGWRRQHIHVMEDHIGRSPSDCEVVHHKNHVKTDNRLENLVLMVNFDHTSLHHTGSKRSKEQIENIKNGIRSSKRTKLTESSAKSIRLDGSSGLSPYALADKYGVSVTTVARVARNESRV